MVRDLMLVALLSATAACGGSDGNEEPDDKPGEPEPARADSTADSPPTDAGAGAAAQVTPNLVTNASAQCAAAKDCSGAGPECITTMTLAGQAITFAGGYCSAVCGNDIECGSEGECPVGESLKAFTGGGLISSQLLATFVPSHCYKPCSSNADCRMDSGYRCARILDALAEGGAMLSFAGFDVRGLLSGPIADGLYCLPPPPAMGGATP